MRCALGHRHPPVRVVVVPRNLTTLRGRSRYHCPECPELAREATGVGRAEYVDPASARRAGRVSPCRQCFPASPSRRRTSSEPTAGGWIVTRPCGWSTPALAFHEAALAMRGHPGHGGFITRHVRSVVSAS